VLVAVFLTRAGSDREAVHPPELVARLALADSLGDAVGADGSVWLDDKGGDRLLRVDPGSRRVTARIPVGGDAALAPAGETLWALYEQSTASPTDFRGQLLRVDARSNRVAARLALRTPSGEPFAGHDLAADRDNIWVAGTIRAWHDDDTLGLLRLDPRTGRATTVIELPRGWGRTGIALRAGSLWAITAGQHLLRFDAGTGKLLSDDRLDLAADDREPQSGQLQFAGDTLITSTLGGLVGIDPYGGRVVWRRPLDVNAWTVAYDLLWVTANPLSVDRLGGADRLFALNPKDGRRVTTSVELDAFGTSDIASVRDELWITTAGGEALVLRR